jgi:hypothetical protein
MYPDVWHHFEATTEELCVDADLLSSWIRMLREGLGLRVSGILQRSCWRLGFRIDNFLKLRAIDVYLNIALTLRAH